MIINNLFTIRIFIKYNHVNKLQKIEKIEKQKYKYIFSI